MRFTARTGQLYPNDEGDPFIIKGINWRGAEDGDVPPVGLTHHEVDFYLDFLVRHPRIHPSHPTHALAAFAVPAPLAPLAHQLTPPVHTHTQHTNKFNAIKLHFNHASILANSIVQLESSNKMQKEWEGFTYMAMLTDLVEKAAAKKILVVLTCGRLSAQSSKDAGQWQDQHMLEQQIHESWQKIVDQFCNSWNVAGVDLFNDVRGARTRRVPANLARSRTNRHSPTETRPHLSRTAQPHAVSWKEWSNAAGRLGNTVLGRCPRLLVFVEGVGRSKSFFPGEDLSGVLDMPVELRDPHKLVYSPHVFGPGFKYFDYVDEHEFPGNLNGLWQSRFGYIPHATGAPVVFGTCQPHNARHLSHRAAATTCHSTLGPLIVCAPCAGAVGGQLTRTGFKEREWYEFVCGWIKEHKSSFFLANLSPVNAQPAEPLARWLAWSRLNSRGVLARRRMSREANRSSKRTGRVRTTTLWQR